MHAPSPARLVGEQRQCRRTLSVQADRLRAEPVLSSFGRGIATWTSPWFQRLAKVLFFCKDVVGELASLTRHYRGCERPNQRSGKLFISFSPGLNRVIGGLSDFPRTVSTVYPVAQGIRKPLKRFEYQKGKLDHPVQTG